MNQSFACTQNAMVSWIVFDLFYSKWQSTAQWHFNILNSLMVKYCETSIGRVYPFQQFAVTSIRMHTHTHHTNRNFDFYAILRVFNIVLARVISSIESYLFANALLKLSAAAENSNALTNAIYDWNVVIRSNVVNSQQTKVLLMFFRTMFSGNWLDWCIGAEFIKKNLIFTYWCSFAFAIIARTAFVVSFFSRLYSKVIMKYQHKIDSIQFEMPHIWLCGIVALIWC